MLGHDRLFSSVKAVVYNNTVLGSTIGEEYGAGYNPGDQAGEVLPIWWYCYNNIIDGAGQQWNRNMINIAVDARNDIVVDMSRNDIDRNYIVRPSTSNRPGMHILAGDQDYGDNWSVADFNAQFSTSNYYSSSASGLYQGTSGAQRYITTSSHQLSGGATIGGGGTGGSHPYLPNISFPTHVGATHPTNNAWVSGVLSLASTSTLRSGQEDSPAWIEEIGGGGSVPPPPVVPTATGLRLFEITNPTAENQYTTGSSSIQLGGVSSGFSSFSSLQWTNSAGGNGSGSELSGGQWSISGVSLSPGTNTITVTVWDSNGRNGSDTITVIRQ